MSATRTSFTQFLIMVEYMEKNGDLSKPQSIPNGRQESIKKWKDLTNLLNSHGTGECRSEEKWRKVWSDLKNNTKRKWAKINRSVQGTGGGPPTKIYLTDLENRVMGIMGIQAAVGMDIPELGFGAIDEFQEVVVGPESSNRRRVSHEQDSPTMSPDTIILVEDWNMPGSSKDPDCRPALIPPTPTLLGFPAVQISPPKDNSRKRNASKSVEEYFARCEENAREDNRKTVQMFTDLERERIRQRDVEVELERERIRQRDIELQLHGEWLEIMKGALDAFNKFMNDRMNDRNL